MITMLWNKLLNLFRRHPILPPPSTRAPNHRYAVSLRTGLGITLEATDKIQFERLKKRIRHIVALERKYGK